MIVGELDGRQINPGMNAIDLQYHRKFQDALGSGDMFALYERTREAIEKFPDDPEVRFLQALAMADGFAPTAAPKRAMIIRQPPGAKRIEIPANLRDILSGKKSDVELLPDDILFVPTNATKSALVRAVQTAIQAATSAVVYRSY